MPNRREVEPAILATVFAVAALVAFLPLWVPLVLAAWTALVARPLYDWMCRLPLGSRWAAALTTTGVVTGLVLPTAGAAVALALQAIDLAQSLSASQDPWGALNSLTQNGSKDLLGWMPLEPTQVTNWVTQNGPKTLSTVAKTATHAGVGIIVFVAATYVFLLHGADVYGWFLQNSFFMPQRHFERMSQAFAETGRGLLVGIGLAALLQGLVAGIGYVALGVPQAPVLGFLTAVAAIVPSIGTAVIWLPLAGGFALAGRPGTAAWILALGIVVASADNVIRPLLSRVGTLNLPTFVVFLAMLGGLAAFGASGVLLGPLLARLAAEGLAIVREHPRAA